MSAQMIIFIDDKNLIAFDVSREQAETISFDGSEKLPCTGASTANKFSSYICDNYSLENISEFNDKVILVNCGADIDAVNALKNIADVSNAQFNIVTQDKVAKNAFNALKGDNKLKIIEYGMNFYGRHYLLSNGKLMKKGFLLTGYCLDIKDSIKYVKDEI